jgi:hypothetical protein
MYSPDKVWARQYLRSCVTPEKQLLFFGADSAIVEARLSSSNLDSPVALALCVPLANMGGGESASSGMGLGELKMKPN